MSTTAQIRIFSVDDHPLLHEGLATVIRHQSDMMMVAEANNGQEAIQRFQEHVPDVTLMDLRLPDMSGIDAMIAIRSRFPDARVIILTTFANTVEIQRAFEAGARAYLLKSMPPRELVEVIRHVHAGKKKIPSEIADRFPDGNDEGSTSAVETKAMPANEPTTMSGGVVSQPSRKTRRPQWLSHLFKRRGE